MKELIALIENKFNITYSERQRVAIKNAVTCPLSIITGGPGTGKSLSTHGIIETYKTLNPGHRIYLASPTGRAAKRLEEVTERQAVTIHRLLEYHPEWGFSRDETRPLQGPGLLIADEVSMCDLSLAAALFRAIPHDLKVTLIGDVDQLPSVGPGSVLRDLIDSGIVPTTRLDYVYRQEEGSGIAYLAENIRHGILPENWTRLNDVEVIAVEDREQIPGLVVGKYLEAIKQYGVMGVLALAPMKKGVDGVESLNKAIREKVNPAKDSPVEAVVGGQKWRLRDKVMVIKNNYRLDVFNGDVGTVEGISEKPPRGLHVNIDGSGMVFFNEEEGEVDILTLAYASTVHKCVALDTLIETNCGLIRISDAEYGLVASIGGPNSYIRTPNQPIQEMLRITTKDGYSVTVTPDHGLDSWDGKTYSRFEARELKIGDWLQIGLGVRLEPECLPLLPNPSNGDIREHIFQVPKELTEELAEFLGLMVADGSNFACGFRLAKRYKEVVDRFSALCVNLFGAKPKKWSERNAYFAEVDSVYLRRWLTQVGGMEPNKKAIPRCILSGTSLHHRAFLRGLFEDATVNVRERNGVIELDHIEFCTCREQLAKDVQVMLARLGIISRRTQNYKGLHAIHKIYIYGQHAKTFGRIIGFISEKKRIRCGFSVGAETRYLIPVTREEATELRRMFPNIFSRSDLSNARIRGHISRAKAKAITMIENAPTWLTKRAASHHDRIASIERVWAPSTCLHVPNKHLFLQNAISGWNSQGSEAPVVIMVLTRGHWIMLQRNLFYTAITRAKKRLVIICQPEAVKRAVENNRIAERNSRLASLVKAE